MCFISGPSSGSFIEFFEITISLPQGAPYLRKLTRPEDNQGNDHNNDQMHRLETDLQTCDTSLSADSILL